jgi:predicted HicB family RNase H-like nuclease
MAPVEKPVPYALRIRSRKLHAELQRIATTERRSLNEIINIAIEQYITHRKDRS